MKNSLPEILSVSSFNQTAKCLIILAHSDAEVPTAKIKEIGLSNGLRAISKWNVGALLRASPGRVAHLPSGWSLLEGGRNYLAEQGFEMESDFQTIQSPMRKLISKVKSEILKSYLQESIVCFDNHCYRAAIILSWSAAVEALRIAKVYDNFGVFSDAFDAQYPKKAGLIKCAADLENMKESEFLSVLERMGVFGRTLRKQFDERLSLRNAAGHPSDSMISKLQAAAHMEFLLQKVFLEMAL